MGTANSIGPFFWFWDSSSSWMALWGNAGSWAPARMRFRSTGGAEMASISDCGKPGTIGWLSVKRARRGDSLGKGRMQSESWQIGAANNRDNRFSSSFSAAEFEEGLLTVVPVTRQSFTPKMAATPDLDSFNAFDGWELEEK